MKVAKKLLNFFKNRDNLSLVIAAMAFFVSLFSVVFSVIYTQKQFELNYRPFVGISDLKIVFDRQNELEYGNEHKPQIMEVHAIIKNVGSLPASDIGINWSWWISKINYDKKLFLQKGKKEKLTLFPGLHIVHVLTYQGTYLKYYILDEGYELFVDYTITYNNVEISRKWTFKHTFKYNWDSQISVLNSSAN